MLFSSLVFLWYFLPAVFFLYFITKNLHIRNSVLLTASLFFYAWGEPKYVILMLVSIGLNYFFGLWIGRMQSKHRMRLAVTTCVFLNLLLLGYFKYFNFAVEIANSLLSRFAGGAHTLSFREIALPVGISFYTFQALSYVVDVYRGENQAQKNPLNMMLYISFFPQLIAGPIVKYHDIEEQIENRTVTLEGFSYGVKRFIFGLGKKVILANTFAEVVDAVYAYQAADVSQAMLWLTALLYMLQIYFDFSGYTDMAVGAALMLGLRLPENFAAPYKATGIVDFWRRWHMTLGRWLHDCLYQPLGGSRHGRVRQYANLLLTMLVCGVWHGAGLTFLLWGALHGLLLLVNHAFRHLLRGSLAERVLALPPLRALCVLVTFLCLTVAWVLFRAGDTGTALHVWQSMFLWSDGHPLPLQQGLEALLPGGLLEPRLLLPLLAVCAVIVWALPCSQHVMLGRADGSRPWLHWQPNLLWAVALALPALASLLLMQGHAFLSFRF